MLYVVATPIGNLEDITFRALRVLRGADYIFCEDTRVTRKLLDHYDIGGKKLIAYHHHTSDKKVQALIETIKENNVALVTDAGTPGISDPGNKLISRLVETQQNRIIPIPGPSAVTAALSISGLPTDEFIFLGFIPHKKGRNKLFKEILNSKRTVVFYESPHRILKTLDSLIALKPLKKLIVCRELTKKFEIIYRGSAEEILEQIKKDFPSGKPKGEFVLVVG